MKLNVKPPIVALGSAILVVTGCVANAPAGGSTIAVTSTENACEVATNTATSGVVVFDVTNEGEQVTEFYLLADDALRIIGEVENIAPGSSRTLTTTVQPGEYLTLCKPGMIGTGVGQAEFSVSGEQVSISGPGAEQKQQAIDLYAAFVKDQVAQLVPATEGFVELYVNGDDEAAKEQFPDVRTHYERIEPVAEALGDLDPRIDYREVDAVAEGLDWTGFHRIEKDLWEPAPGSLNSDGETDAWENWEPSTPDQREEFGALLVADVTELYEYVHSDDFTTYLSEKGVDWLSNGAIALLDEVAAGKITGEEDWWSGTDLLGLRGQRRGLQDGLLAGAGLRRSAGRRWRGPGRRYRRRLLPSSRRSSAEYGNLTDGFVNYSELTDEDKRALTNLINALAEPLAQLTSTVLA